MPRFVLAMLCLPLLSGCYYAQAAKGQWQLTREREPITDVLARADTSPELAARLRLVLAARRFAIDELALPDNESYRSYADIERDFVVWNVFAAPEFSLQPKTWCFPVAGCVAYRGYFSRDAAARQARKLAAKGFDVAVGEVAAYSTLGKLKDPVLSTMMNWDDTRLVGVLFHELAHQVLYVKGDTEFNESFATAVEEFGVTRWLEQHGDADGIESYRSGRELRQELMQLVAAARDELGEIYDSPSDDQTKRWLKRQRLSALQKQAGELLRRAGRDPSSWLQGELNNARLVSLTLYEGRLPEFRALFEACARQFACFYVEAGELAGREPRR